MNIQHFFLTVILFTSGKIYASEKNTHNEHKTLKRSQACRFSIRSIHHLQNLYTQIPFNNKLYPFEELRRSNCLSKISVIYFSDNTFKEMGTINELTKDAWLSIAEGNALYWSRIKKNAQDVLGIWRGDFCLHQITETPNQFNTSLAQIMIMFKRAYLNNVKPNTIYDKQ